MITNDSLEQKELWGEENGMQTDVLDMRMVAYCSVCFVW